MPIEPTDYRMRMSAATFETLRQEFCRDPSLEQFVFATATMSAAHGSYALIIDQLFLPDPGDLAVQSRHRVAPSRAFQSAVYTIALQRQVAIVDIHSHTQPGPVSFSEEDRREMQRNAQYVVSQLPVPMTLVTVVVDKNLEHFEAAIYDRESDTFRAIDWLEIIGRPMRQLASTPLRTEPISDTERYSRQMLLRYWNQPRLSDLRVAIVGQGGNGAQLLMASTSIGAGEQGWTAVFDRDVVERSNLPRIPYATPDDCGRAKVAVAADYVRRRHKQARFYPSVCAVTEHKIPQALKAADVIIGCVDSDPANLALNEIAIRFGVPLIATACDVRNVENRTIAGGQVRVVVPGTTACLVCSGGLDSVQIAFDEMPTESKGAYQRRGYTIGSAQDAAPSVTSLNALAAHYAIGALLALYDIGPVQAHDYLGYNWSAGTTLTAATRPRPDCPVCGEHGVLFLGDSHSGTAPERNALTDQDEPAWIPVSKSTFE